MNNRNIGISLEANEVTEGRLKLIAQAGFTHVALAATDMAAIPIATDLGLTVDHVHLSFDDVVNDIWVDNPLIGDTARDYLEAELLAAAIFDVDKAVLHLKHGSETKLTVSGLNRHLRLLDYAQFLGMTLCYENQSSSSHLLQFYKQVSHHPAAGICFDFGHSHLKNYPELLHAPILTGHVKAIHIHSNDGTSDQHRLPLDAALPWEPLLADLQETGYVGPIMLEPHKGSFYDNLTDEQFYHRAAEQAAALSHE